MCTKQSVSILAVVVALAALPMASAPAAGQLVGDSHVFAPVPSPGFPEGIAVRGHRVYVAGPATFGQPLGSATVFAYDRRTGALDATYPITITNPFAGMSGASCAAFGADGGLYVIEPFVGVIYRLPLVASPSGADLEEVHRYPFVPWPPPVLPGPDGIAFGKSGKLYVALAGTSQISVLRPDGSEEARLSGQPGRVPGDWSWGKLGADLVIESLGPSVTTFDDARELAQGLAP